MVYSSISTNEEYGGTLHFRKFETERIEQCYDFLKNLQAAQAASSSSSEKLRLVATGGGAYRFYDEMKERLDIDVQREDEMECLIMGKLIEQLIP